MIDGVTRSLSFRPWHAPLAALAGALVFAFVLHTSFSSSKAPPPTASQEQVPGTRIGLGGGESFEEHIISQTVMGADPLAASSRELRNRALALLDGFHRSAQAALGSPSGLTALRDVVREMGYACLSAELNKQDIGSRLGSGNSAWSGSEQIGIEYYPNVMLVFSFDSDERLVDIIDCGTSLRTTMHIQRAAGRASAEQRYDRIIVDSASTLRACRDLLVTRTRAESAGDAIVVEEFRACYLGMAFGLGINCFESSAAAFAHLRRLVEYSPTYSDEVAFEVAASEFNGIGDVQVLARIGSQSSLCYVRNNVLVTISYVDSDPRIDDAARELDAEILARSMVSEATGIED